jgi:hypothetical protein
MRPLGSALVIEGVSAFIIQADFSHRMNSTLSLRSLRDRVKSIH